MIAWWMDYLMEMFNVATFAINYRNLGRKGKFE